MILYKTKAFTKCLLIVFILLTIQTATFAQENKTSKSGEADPKMVAEAVKKFPANQWVMESVNVVIPEKWNQGRYLFINSYGSIVYCESLGTAITVDGYTYAPQGKAPTNNYADSVYTYNPMKNELELFRKNNWRAGQRGTQLETTSYPFDENKTDPTPCPRHIYKGITWVAETDTFYLINGANAGVPNKHPKYEENMGTTTSTFWSLDIKTKKWKLLERPAVKRLDVYETILTSIPNTNKLIYIDEWNVISYDIKEEKWTPMMGNGPSPVKSLKNGSAVLVDSKRQKIIFYGGAAWKPVKENPPSLTSNQLYAYDVASNTFETITGEGTVELGKMRPCAYLAKIDKYFYLTTTGQYLFDPTNNKWKKLNIGLPDVPHQWCYMTYDTKRDLIIMNDGRKWGVLRLDESSL